MSALKSSADEFVSSMRQLMQKRELVAVEQQLKDHIISDPLDAATFGLLAELRAHSGHREAAVAAERRWRQLLQITANLKPAHVAEQYQAVCAHSAKSADSLSLNEFIFAGLRRHENCGQVCMIGCSLDGRAFLKLELKQPDGELEGLEREIQFLQRLTDRGCLTCGKLVGSGYLGTHEIPEAILVERELVKGSNAGKCPYAILEYVRADHGGFGLADLVLTLLEQQALGVYQNCLALPQIRYDSLQGLCRLTDYRSAVFLSNEQRELPPQAFLEWCIEQEGKRNGSGEPESFFKGRVDRLDQLFFEGRFKLVQAQFFGRQRIADMPLPCIQHVNTHTLALLGTTPIDDRIQILEGLSFQRNERVLDLGCASGGVSRYLNKKDCRVTAVDCEEQLVKQTQFLANLSGEAVDARVYDLEFDFPDEPFDTILVLALFPHVSKRRQLAHRISATGARRIIVECALEESGFRWQGSSYHLVEPAWRFGSSEEIMNYLRELFPDYPQIKDLGESDTKRHLYLLEPSEELKA